MDLEHLIKHPEFLDKETLYDLRSLLAMYPYYQTARLLMLQNLYLLHDPSFDEELRRAAIYITDRRTLFNLVEAAHYKLRVPQSSTPKSDEEEETSSQTAAQKSRTLSLIDRFLDSLPTVEEQPAVKGKRKPTPADAAVDYVAYLLETEDESEKQDEQPLMRRQDLIDNFIKNDSGKIELKENPEFSPQLEEFEKNEENNTDEGYFTETLARIYIKQGRYLKALEIIKRLNLIYPKKNAYFADQIRFLEKLIINSNKNK